MERPYHVQVNVVLCLRSTEEEVGIWPETVRRALMRELDDDVKVMASSGYILLMQEGHTDGHG